MDCHRTTTLTILVLAASLSLGCQPGAGFGEQPGAPPATPPVIEHLDAAAIDPDTVARIDLALSTVRDEPEAWYTWLDLGMVYHANEFYPQAIASYEQAAALGPEHAKPHYLMALALEREGRLQDAIDATRRAVEILPTEATFQWRLGHLLLGAGEVDAAEEALAAALELDPDSDAVLIDLARVALKRNQPQEAVDFLSAAAGHTESNRPYINHLLVSAYQRLGETDKANVALLDADTSPPRFDDPWLVQVAHQRTSDVSVVRTAVDLLQAGESAEAIRLLEGLRETSPDNLKMLEALGVAYARSDRLSDAVTAFERVVKLEPGRAKGYEDLARALMHRYDTEVAAGDSAVAERTYATAMEHVNSATDLDPELASAHSLRGDLLRRTGQYLDAAAAYEVARGLEPQELAYGGRAAHAYTQAEDWSNATRVLEALTQAAPGDAAAWRYLALSRLRLGQFDDSADALDRASALDPDNEEVAALRAELAAERAKR